LTVAAVLLVKNEQDIIFRTVSHFLGNVDEVIVQDNLSTDGTTEILASLAAEYPQIIHILDDDPQHYQSRKMTALARVAYERGHRWVIPSDADEIWLAPEGRTLRDWLAVVGGENQFVKAAIYNHVCSGLDDPTDPDPVRRIEWRKALPLDIRWGKVACRCREDLVIHNGSHSASTEAPGITTYGLEIRHFPYRSAQQFVTKAVTCYQGLLAAVEEDEGTGAHCRAYGQAIEEGGEEAGHAWFYDAFYAEDPYEDDTLVHGPAPELPTPLNIRPVTRA
jgi:glycosyltransferase involved in cell wall biosynthesis